MPSAETLAFEFPVIDLGRVMRGSPSDADYLAVGKEVLAACTGVGFFYIRNHGVPNKVVSDLFSEMRSFFRRPVAEKREIALEKSKHHVRGYHGVDEEQTLGKPDHKEGLDYGVDFPADDPRVLAKVPLHGPNPWPARQPSLKTACDTWVPRMLAVCEVLMKCLCRSMGHSVDLWRKDTCKEDPFYLYRLLSYPKSDNADQIGIGEHTDFGWLAVLAATSAGLEVCTTDGRWVAVPQRDDNALLCNLGDMIAHWTSGLLKATLHRVVTVGEERMSAPFFYEPSFASDIAPLDLPDELFNKYGRVRTNDTTTINYGEHVTTAMRRSFPNAFSDEAMQEE